MRKLLLIGSFSVAAFTASIECSKAAWKEDVYRDRLSERKIVRMSTSAKGVVRQFGRVVTVKVTVACTNPWRDQPQYRDEDYLAAFLVFSERVGVGDAIARYRFDERAAQETGAGITDDGRSFSLSESKTSDFVPAIRAARRLRIEIRLPWAGAAFVEADVSEANQAFEKIPCGPTRP
jgi:hypothetical protein